ncbi:MAG: penicillin-binding protein 2 [Planctomycetes bacterium]|nr:penicillin-binding protein 2 [Planctomycetota bacterium]
MPHLPRATRRIDPAAGQNRRDDSRSLAVVTRRGASMVLVLAVAGLVLVARLVQLQAIERERFARQANRQRSDIETLPARPGDIVDRRGRLLATTITRQSLYVDPSRIDDPAAFAAKLAGALDLDATELAERLSAARSRRFLWVRRRLDDDTTDAVRALELPSDTWGFREEYLRRYPQGVLAAHVLGLRGIDNRGRGGIEQRFDDLLRGRDGRRVLIRDARGRAVEVRDEATTAPLQGRTIVLSLDLVVQLFVEEQLDAIVAEWQPIGACGIVMEPSTGRIVAMASRPVFNPDPALAEGGRQTAEGSEQETERGERRQAERGRPEADTDSPLPTAYRRPPTVGVESAAWKNLATAAVYEPGSTFKPLIVAWALDRETVSPDETIDCESGAWRMGRRLLHDHHSYGELSLTDIIARSSNIGMAKIGQRLTNTELYRATMAFGFGRRTGIELPGEVDGLVRPLSQWNSYSTGSVPMGQEIAVTPLQLVAAHAALAGGGRWIAPRLVLADVDAVEAAVSFPGPAEGPHMRAPDAAAPLVSPTVSAEAARWVVEEAMTAVVERGTGKPAQLPGRRVFGKTGTAQKIDPETGGYSKTRSVCSFVGGAPAEAPRLVVLVLVDEPRGASEAAGGRVAAAAVGRILDRALDYLGEP